MDSDRLAGWREALSALHEFDSTAGDRGLPVAALGKTCADMCKGLNCGEPLAMDAEPDPPRGDVVAVPAEFLDEAQPTRPLSVGSSPLDEPR